MGSSKKIQAPSKAKKPLKRPEKRTLVRWNDDLDRKLLLCIQSACNAQGLRIPWDKAADLMGPSVSEGAIIQHLAKLRIRVKDLKLPPLRRGGAPMQRAKSQDELNNNGKRGTRSRKTAGEGGSSVDDHEFNDAFNYDPESEFMEEDAEADSDNDNGHVGKKAKVAGGVGRAKRGYSNASFSNVTENPDDDYLESASEVDDNISESSANDHGAGSKGSTPEGSVVALGAKFLSFTNDSASNSTEDRRSESTQASYTDGQTRSLMVKFNLPIGHERVTGLGKTPNGADKTPWLDPGTSDMAFLKAQDNTLLEHRPATGNNHQEQVSGVSPGEYTLSPHSLQATSMGQHNTFVGPHGSLHVPESASMTYPQFSQSGVNNGGMRGFPPPATPSNTTYGQYPMGIGNSGTGIQGFNVSNSQGSYGSHAFGANSMSGGGWGSAPGLAGFNAHSSPDTCLFNDVTLGADRMGMTDAINPGVLERSDLFWGHGGVSQAGNHFEQSDFKFGEPGFYAGTQAQSNFGTALPDFPDFDDMYGDGMPEF
ncbi:hypothetical protein FQN54_007725 [Arachnomyces sp. PD_36]|nr:hypothetical protein FQN54_007725 [Arachnomyces sp. PD_36]